MWAIKSNGIGNPVSARRIGVGWDLDTGETLVDDDAYEPGMILDNDDVTLRHRRNGELVKQEKLAELAATDHGIPKVVEDLIEALITKGVISMSDLSVEAIDKINNRKTLRSQIGE